MSNKPRNILPDYFYHVYNRAVEKRTIFYTEKDYEFFINKALFYKEQTRVKILAYCILPNHWHFLLKEPTCEVAATSQVGSSSMPNISNFISLLSNSYTKYFNHNKDHSGRIFQGQFKSKIVEKDSYLQVLIGYINLNPLKHKITNKPDDWYYTSHHNYLGQVKLLKIVDKDDLIDFGEYSKGIGQYIKRLPKIDGEF